MIQLIAIKMVVIFCVVMLFVVSLVVAEDNLEKLVEELGTCETQELLDVQVSKIVKRLDELTTTILRNERELLSAKSVLRKVLSNEGGLAEGRDVQLWPVFKTDDILVVYNVPYSGAIRKVALRLWETGKNANESKLRPFDENNEEYAKISYYPVVDVQFLIANNITYIVLLGEVGHGRGKRAVSVWNMRDGMCILAREFDWGENVNVVVKGEMIELHIEWDNPDTWQVESKTEIYVCSQGIFRKQSKAEEHK